MSSTPVASLRGAPRAPLFAATGEVDHKLSLTMAASQELCWLVHVIKSDTHSCRSAPDETSVVVVGGARMHNPCTPACRSALCSASLDTDGAWLPPQLLPASSPCPLCCQVSWARGSAAPLPRRETSASTAAAICRPVGASGAAAPTGEKANSSAGSVWLSPSQPAGRAGTSSPVTAPVSPRVARSAEAARLRVPAEASSRPHCARLSQRLPKTLSILVVSWCCLRLSQRRAVRQLRETILQDHWLCCSNSSVLMQTTHVSHFTLLLATLQQPLKGPCAVMRLRDTVAQL